MQRSETSNTSRIVVKTYNKCSGGHVVYGEVNKIELVHENPALKEVCHTDYMIHC